MENKKTFSCSALHNALYLAPDELRHCCKRFYVKGKMKGDVKIFPVKSTKDINPKNILEAKKKLYEDINSNKETECTGCPFLVKDHWPSLDKLEIKHLSIESHSVCNMKCTYCNETYYGGKKANYDLEKVLKDLINSNNTSKEISVAWGGGEPVLLDNFDKIFEMVNEKMQPATTMVYTNAIKYNQTIEKYLKKGTIKLTTSIDAGTEETFKKVRGVKTLSKVLLNLKKYFSEAKKGIVIKYILTEDNFSDLEINSFLKKIEENELQNCEFQISSDFTDENISKNKIFSALKLYFGLKRLGENICFVDYHLRPRLQDAIKDFILSDDKGFKKLLSDYNPNGLNFENIKKVIIWGAGDTGRSIINDSFILKKYGIKISSIVDSDHNLHEKKICGYSVKKPKSVLDYEDPIIIASTARYEEIQNYLNRIGVKKNRILDGIYF